MDNLDSLPLGKEEAQDQLRMACVRLMEMFDSVQIVASRKNEEDQSTDAHFFGLGNWYARYGSVKEWILEAEAIMESPAEGLGDDDVA